MMNNQYNTANLNTQHALQMTQHVTTSSPQASASVLSPFLNAQQQQQQFAAGVSAGSIFTDPRHFNLNGNNIDKNYYTTAATLDALGTTQRFYPNAGTTSTGTANTSAAATSIHHPNTILITNNFTHQQIAQPLSPEQQRNIRIVTSGGTHLNSANTGNLTTTGTGFQHSQHVFNINSDKQLQHLFPQHLLQQQNYPTAAAPTELLPQQFTTHHFSASQPSHTTTSALQMPQFYVSAENAIAPLSANQKIITNIPSNTVTSASGSTAASLVANSTNGTTTNPNNSTVVLDRINICINNLYTDTSSSSSASNSLASTPAQQPSPIIPAIQHKAVIENELALPLTGDVYESNVLIIDEPDSTTTATTPHTPPTTPENTSPSMPNNANNNNNNIISTTSLLNSPSTSSYNHQQIEKLNAITTKQNFSSVVQSIEKTPQNSPIAMDIPTESINPELNQNAQTTQIITSNSPLTPPTPSLPAVSITIDKNKNYQMEDKPAPNFPAVPLFSNGEDVFIKRHDGRFYLGTVIDTARNQFLVRFDDKTEIWCNADEMRKLGISSSNNTNSTEENSNNQPMCVACKRLQPDSKVEICERCGRGYHRKCTSETLPGSEIWLCKRCAKPMKLDNCSKLSSTEDETENETGHHLHYNIESLTWDAKHRMNLEQIYCYCGKTGKFDNNMLQCWRCLNWYHTHCIKRFTSNILRGDSFFVFCCSVCNGGEEYLRRLQANWVEMVHLALYSLSTVKKHQKYYHLLKDISPFVLEKRKMFPIPKEWISLPDKQFLDKIKSILNENAELFLCGKEVKRDPNLYALRTIEPPLAKKITIKSQDALDDHFIFNILKLQVLRDAPENCDFIYINTCSKTLENTCKPNSKAGDDSSSHDVYEFDENSEDDVPIKHKSDNTKKRKITSLSELKTIREDKNKTITAAKTTSPITTLEKMDVENDNANDAVINKLSDLQTENDSTTNVEVQQTPTREEISIEHQKIPLENKKSKQEALNINHTEKTSRKRKAFKLSKSYNGMRLFDSSSDENSSSSSRGTSLDLIIPPPKNFLGQNNPFRIISPKKNSIDNNANTASTSSGKKSVSFGIFNTTGLNFSSKLAGLFPNLSTTNLAKAAGQPRTVRTIKRRLSAKDITIGPNKEVRRRRTRRLSSNIEIISTTTINPIPTNFFPIQAKDLLAAAAATTTNAASLFTITQNKTSSASLNNINSSTSSSPTTESVNMKNTAVQSVPTHGRLLRQRPQKNSPNTSRRSSISSNQSTTSSASTGAAGNTLQSSHEDLKQTVNKYFGIVNRIESGEQFSIRAKRQLPNGQMQYLIEWGETQLSQSITTQTNTNTITTNTTG